MADSRKLLLETLKNVKSGISEIIRFIDSSNEEIRQTLFEIIEYGKRRSEIELEYNKSLIKLKDRLSERNAKFDMNVKERESNFDQKNCFYLLCRAMEWDTESRAETALLYSELYAKRVLPGLNLFAELQVAKYMKCKELVAVISEKLNEYIVCIYSKREKYVEAYNQEEKSKKAYTKIINKSKKSPSEAKGKKAYDFYSRDIGLTDEERNGYILSFNSAKSCLDMVNTQLMSDISLLYNYKFSEFGEELKATIMNSLEKEKRMIEKISNEYEKINFSDFCESDLMLSKFNIQVTSELSDNFKICLRSDDPIRECIINEKHFEKLQEKAKLAETSVTNELEQINKLSISISSEKEIKYDWGFCQNNDKLKTNKTQLQAIMEKSSSYFSAAKEYLILQLELMYSKTFYSSISRLIMIPYISTDRTPQFFLDAKKKYGFSVSLREYYSIFGVSIPIPLTMMISYLVEKDLLKKEGIFRIAATKSQLSSYVENLSSRGEVDQSVTPYVVACSIKQYLRELKDFISESEISAFQEIAYAQEIEFIPLAEKLLEDMDAIARNLLIFLAKFIEFVSRFTETNKMTIESLSIVMGPAIFSRADSTNPSVQESLNKFLSTLCENIYKMYPGEQDFLNSSLFSVENGIIDPPVTDEVIKTYCIEDEPSKESYLI